MIKYLPGIFLLITTGLLTLLVISISPSGLVWATYHTTRGGGGYRDLPEGVDVIEVWYDRPASWEPGVQYYKDCAGCWTNERDPNCSGGKACKGPRNDDDDDDDDTGPPPPPQPSCTASVSPSSFTIERYGGKQFNVNVSEDDGNINEVRYSSSDNEISTVNPNSETTQPFKVTGSANSFPGIAQIIASVFMSSSDYPTVTEKCSGTASLTVNPNCNSVSLNPFQTIQTGDISYISGGIVNLFGNGIANFSANPGGIIGFSPATVNANGSSFSTQVIAANPGFTDVTASIDATGKNGQPNLPNKCSATVPVNVKITAPVAWWQTKDADVWAKSGSINSQIPGTYDSGGDGWCDGRYFSCVGAGGYPGVANAPGGGTFRMGTVSSRRWLATSGYAGPTYNYQWFAGQIPSDVTVVDLPDTINGGTLASGTNPGHGYLWFRRNGNLTIDSHVPMGGNKAILFVTGNLTIKGTIALNDGSGLFMAVVGGNINIDPSVSHTGGETPGGNAGPGLEGLFVSDGTIYTGSKPGPSEADEQLYIRGSLVANGGLTLERDLDPQHLDPALANKRNEKTPAEAIEFAPDLFFTFPRDLMGSRVTWSEVAP